MGYVKTRKSHWVIDIEVRWNGKLREFNPAFPEGPQYWAFDSYEEAYKFLEDFIIRNYRTCKKHYVVRDKDGHIKSETHTLDDDLSITSIYNVRAITSRHEWK